MKTIYSQLAFDEAQQLFPGGVNSPVRAFKAVGGTPIFMDRGEGAYIYDVDGNQLVDYVLSWGPGILGHAHPGVVDAVCQAAKNGLGFGAPTLAENKLATFILSFFPSMDRLRFVSSGTEATMSALRLARAYTKRDKIIKFTGCYHGHADMLLAQAGSGIATLGLPDSAGVTAATTKDTLVVPFNDFAALEKIFSQHTGDIAGLIVEPIPGNMGFVRPQDGFLESAQQLCKKYGSLFIMDEVMTGFRVAMGGAQVLWNLDPDITCLAKIIGGGLPAAAYGGKKHIMDTVAPLGPMYQAGTLSGNPVAMAAGLATLNALAEPGLFGRITERTLQLVSCLKTAAAKYQIAFQADCEGAMFGFFFQKGGTIYNYESAKQYVDTERYAKFFHLMLDRGFYLAPSAFEAGFMSAAHTADDIGMTVKAAEECFRELANT